MAETTKTETKKVDVPVKGKQKSYTFTREGVVIEAVSLGEAQKLYIQSLKQNKESDNG